MLIKFKTQSEFTKHVLTLISGTGMSQIILIIFSPILTRIYSPEEFGIFALYVGVVTFIASLSAGRYDFAILKPRKYYEAMTLLLLSLFLVLIVSIISLFTIIIFFDYIVELIKIHEYIFIIYFIPISILITAIFQILSFWNNRNKNFKLTSYGNISKSIFISLLQTSSYKIGFGLIIGQIIGNLISVFVISKDFVRKDIKNIHRINIKHIKATAIKYKYFPTYNLMHMLVTSVRGNGLIILISLFFGNLTLGFYSLAMRALVVPVSVIGNSVGQVFYQKIASMNAKRIDIYDFSIKTLKIQFFLSIPIFTLIYFISPKLFSFVFGEKWEIAGNYVQALSPYIFFVFILSSISSIAIVLNKQKEMFYFGIIESLLIISTFIAGNLLEIRFINILYILSIVMSFYSTILIYWHILILKKNKEEK